MIIGAVKLAVVLPERVKKELILPIGITFKWSTWQVHGIDLRYRELLPNFYIHIYVLKIWLYQ